MSAHGNDAAVAASDLFAARREIESLRREVEALTEAGMEQARIIEVMADNADQREAEIETLKKELAAERQRNGETK